jgi:hypothetical protein
MSFHDMPYEVAEQRIEDMRREAAAYRRAAQAHHGRRSRARGWWRLRGQAVTTRMSDFVRAANELVDAIIIPPWPTSEQPRRYARPGANR